MAILPAMGKMMTAMKELLVVVGVVLLGAAATPPWAADLLEQFVWMRDSLVEASYFCALAAVAPTPQDQYVLAMRVVNVLEGADGPHFDPRLADRDMPGVLPRLEAVAQWLEEVNIPPQDREAIEFSLRNVRAFLTLALEAALRTAKTRRLVVGAIGMRQAYAFILAALGPEDPDLAYLGGIRPLLGRYGPPPTPPSSDRTSP